MSSLCYVLFCSEILSIIKYHSNIGNSYGKKTVSQPILHLKRENYYLVKHRRNLSGYKKKKIPGHDTNRKYAGQWNKKRGEDPKMDSRDDFIALYISTVVSWIIFTVSSTLSGRSFLHCKKCP